MGARMETFEPVAVVLVGDRCTVRSAYPPHENPAYKVKVYAPGITPSHGQVPPSALLPLLYRFTFPPGTTVRIDAYSGDGETSLFSVTYRHDRAGLIVDHAASWTIDGRWAASQVESWVQIVNGSSPEVDTIGFVVAPIKDGWQRSLSWRDAQAAARRQHHRLEDAGRSLDGRYRLARCAQCQGLIAALNADEAGGDIVYQACNSHSG